MTGAAGQTVAARPAALTPRDRALAEGLSLVYITLIAVFARAPGLSFLLFPELAALSHDVLARPWGKWARQPWRLIATPTLTAIAGTVITRSLPYHVLTVLLIVSISVIVIAILKSNIAPAISAGVLPLVLGTRSWLYPLSIFLGLVALAALSVWWRKRCDRRYRPWKSSTAPDIDDILESSPSDTRWFLPWIAFSSPRLGFVLSSRAFGSSSSRP